MCLCVCVWVIVGDMGWFSSMDMWGRLNLFCSLSQVSLYYVFSCFCLRPGRVAQSVGHLTRKSEVPHTFVSPSADSRRAVVSYWRKYAHEVLVNRLGGQSLRRKSVVRLTDRPDMTLDVFHGGKTTAQQQQQQALLKGIALAIVAR